MNEENLKNRDRYIWEYIDLFMGILQVFLMGYAAIFMIENLISSSISLAVAVLFGALYILCWIAKNPFIITIMYGMVIISIFLIFPLAISSYLSFSATMEIPSYFYILIFPIGLSFIYLLFAMRKSGDQIYIDKKIAVRYGFMGYGKTSRQILFQDSDPEKQKQEIEQIKKFKKYYHEKSVNLITILITLCYLITFNIGFFYL